MNDATLQGFRMLATALCGPQDWAWEGPHMSQKMIGISEDRAKEYAARHGGEAVTMVEMRKRIDERYEAMKARRALLA